MTRSTGFSLTACLLVSGGALPARAEAKNPLDAAQIMRSQLIETRRWFHQHAELSNREFETSVEIARRMTALGYQVQTGVAHTGVVATLKGGQPGPLLAWRADMDALPIEEKRAGPWASQQKGVMHACGHDVHVTVALGAAEVLVGMKAQLRGSVRFIFQPAEEGPPPGEEGGAALMLKQGVFAAPPAAIFALHAMPSYAAGDVAVQAGPILASADRFLLRILGKGAHGATPHDGLDAVYVGAQVVQALQGMVTRQHDARKPLVVTVGKFSAGSRFNVLAEEATLEGTVRTLDPDVAASIGKDVERVVAGVTAAYGARHELHYTTLAPLTANHADLSQRARGALLNRLGKTHVHDWTPAMIAEDFGHYANRVPGFYFFLGVGNPKKGITAGLHTPDFDVDEDALVTGVGAAVTLLTEVR
jgi:amidohydrolase